jgi:Protein of unknown function (DUF3105)
MRPPAGSDNANEDSANEHRQRTAVLVAVAVLVVVALTAGGVIRSRQAQREARARDAQAAALGVRTFPDLGGRHLKHGQSYTAYNSVPPTSGPHDPVPAACGVYQTPISDPVQVHDLEHGVIMLQYRPGLDPAQVQALEALGRSYSSHVIVAPYLRLPAAEPVVATAWTRLLALRSADAAGIARLRTFIHLFRQHGPEGIPCPRAN